MRRKLRNLRRLAEIVFIFLAGCAKQQAVTPAQAAHVTKSGAECQVLALIIATTEPDCAQVKKSLAGLLHASPECAEIYTGNNGFQVTCPGDAP